MRARVCLNPFRPAYGEEEHTSCWLLPSQKAPAGGPKVRILQESFFDLADPRAGPKTWQYLQEHGKALDRRASSVYRHRPRFSVFGVGDYSFSPWKVAVSGFYKELQFRTVGSHAGKPIVLDDTAYFVACPAEPEARYIASLLRSEAAREFYSAFLFWDAKRPITAEVLRRLDLLALARELGTEATLACYLRQRGAGETSGEGGLFDMG